MAQRFTVQRFAADGGFTTGGALLLVVTSFAMAAVLGAVASFVSQWFYLVLIFPVVIGALIGAVSAWAIKVGHVRNALIAGVAAFLAGCTALLVMHYSDYLRFKSEIQAARANAPPQVLEIIDHYDEIKANFDKQPAMVRAVVTEMEKEPKALAVLRTQSFRQYIDFVAEQGVSIGRVEGGQQDHGMNLGYVGSYIYWGVEVLIVAGIAFGIAVGKARAPCCTQCNTWKEPRVLGSVLPPAEPAIDAIQQGDLNLLQENKPNSELLAQLMVTSHVCPGCDDKAPVDLKLERVTRTNKGNKRKELTHVTYPGNALPALVEMFSAPPPTPPAPPAKPV